MTTAGEVRTTLAALRALPGLAPPDELATLPERLALGVAGVAIVGMHTRGKSVLFNRLVGAAISAEASVPCTSNGIIAASGPSYAWAMDAAGARVELPSDPTAFRVALARSTGSRYALAFISGPFRMPEGLFLIDTPGLGDPGAAIDPDFAQLTETWRRCGAGACAVVVAVPPGLAGEDVRFFKEAMAVYPTATELLLKRTSSDVSEDDLIDVRDDARQRFGVDLRIVPDARPRGAWGKGVLATVERALSDLGRRAQADLGPDHDHYRALLERAGKLVDTGKVPRTALDAVHALGSDVEGGLRRSVEMARLDLDAEDALRRLDTASEERSAAQKLVRLARQGSPTARSAVSGWMSSSPSLPAGVQLVGVVRAVPGVALDLIEAGRLDASLEDLLTIAESPLSSQMRTAAGLRIARTAMSTSTALRLRAALPPFADSALIAVRVDGERRLDALATAVGARSATRTLRSSAGAWRKCHDAVRAWLLEVGSAAIDGVGRDEVERQCIELMHRGLHRDAELAADAVEAAIAHHWNGPFDMLVGDLDRTFAELDRSIDRCSGLPSAWREALDGRRTMLTRRAVDVVNPVLCREFDRLYSQEAGQMNVHGRRMHLEAVGQWVNEHAGGAPTAWRVQQWVAFSTARGADWERAVARAPGEARARAAAVQRAWQTAYTWSFVGWVGSFVALGANPGFAFVLWLVSFGTWLCARTSKDVAPDPKNYYRLPDVRASGTAL